MALLDRPLDPAQTWGAASVKNGTYTPIGYRVFVAPGRRRLICRPASRPPPGPLSTPLDVRDARHARSRDHGLRQGVVLGPDAAPLAPVLERATAITAFTSGGQSFTLSVRALLPDEAGG